MSGGELNGPIFNSGEWDIIMAQSIPEVEDSVADTVLDMWRDTLDYNIRVNRDRYISETRVTRMDDAAVLNDGTSLYGPWLEGTGSRNAPVTRFKGYGSARDVAQRAQEDISTIAEPAVAQLVEELNT